jgi:hypothetical protein
VRLRLREQLEQLATPPNEGMEITDDDDPGHRSYWR